MKPCGREVMPEMQCYTLGLNEVSLKRVGFPGSVDSDQERGIAHEILLDPG